MSCGSRGSTGASDITTGKCTTQCNTCGSALGTCGCNKPQPAVPVPFYEQACAIQECHVEQVIMESYATSVKTSSTFNMPACNATGTLTIPGLKNIQIGAYLWNSLYGYLKVESFDILASQVVVRNECQAGNASAGTAVPACTLFNVVDPPHDAGSGQLGVFVAVDFLAPANGNCIDIAVTSVAGLTIGSNVQISSGIYRLSAIVNSTTITICNDGAGIIPGTIVEAKDGSGLYITPVTPLSSNACENAANATGSILTCHNNVQAPLDGNTIGQIPVLIDPTTNEVQFQSLDLPTAVCTTMTSCLNLFAGTTSYQIVVADSTIFQIGDIIIIHDPISETYRWEVTGTPDGNHVNITKTTTQDVNEEIGCDNASVCLAPCCEQLSAGTQICDYDWSAAFKTNIQIGTVDDGSSLAPTNTKVGTNVAITVINDTCNVMSVIINVDFTLTGSIAAEEGAWARYKLSPMFGLNESNIGVPSAPAQGLIYDLIEDINFGIGDGEEPCDDYVADFSKSYHYTTVHALTANKQLNVLAHSEVAYVMYVPASAGCCPCNPGPLPNSMTMTIVHQASTINALGVAVQA